MKASPTAVQLTPRTGTLEPGVASDPIDLDTSEVTSLGLLIQNTGGANAITTVALSKSFDGEHFGPADAAGSGVTIAHDAGATFEFSDVTFRTLRVVLTSASGTAYRITGRGV